MSSLPTVQQEPYEREKDNNNGKAEEVFDSLFPEIELPRGDIFKILSFLQETKVNAQILPRVIRGVYNLTVGTGKGQVIIHVQGETVNVQTRETDEEIQTKV